MGNNTITAVVVGALIVVVAFSLWPILNGATNSLFAYFRDSCDDGGGSRFLAVYAGIDDFTANKQYQFNTNTQTHGGSGVGLTPDSNDYCVGSTNFGDAAEYGAAEGVVDAAGVIANRDATDTDAKSVTVQFYNEYGESLGHRRFLGAVTNAGTGSSRAADSINYIVTTGTVGHQYVEVAGVLNFFSGINNILLAIIPVVSIGGFLGISGAKLYSYGRSTGGNIASHLSGSVFTLVALIITIIIAPVIMDSLIGANQVVESGQYRINNQFGTILELLFGAIPLLYIAGLVGLIGMQARSALMGNKGGGKSGMM